jgi:hypothetical protein
MSGSAAAPIELFDCAALRARLSRAGCVRRWSTANDGAAPAPWDSLTHCRCCPIGAGHAGRPPAEMAVAAARDTLARTCTRCGATGGRIVLNRWCVSCYNRQREAERGRNAKGGRPRLMDVLHTERLVVACGTRVEAVEVDRVANLAEAMLLLVGRGQGPVSFGRAPLASPGAA